MKKIIWAVDAFQESKLNQNAIKFLKTFVGNGSRVEIQPTYILTPDQLNVSLEMALPWLEKYKPSAEKALEQLCRGIKSPAVLKPHVIIDSQASLRQSVDTLTTYAKQAKADLIVAGTHGRKGLARFFLGSFAETLVLHSPIPVAIVNPSSTGAGKIKKILFPTDFSKSNEAPFQKVLDLAKSLKAEVVIHHVMPRPLEPVIQSGVYLMGGGWVPFPAHIENEKIKYIQLGKDWVARAKTEGVKATQVVEFSRPSVTESILKYAQKNKIDLIAMTTQVGPVSSVLIGSITRYVLRSAKCPVWVVRST